MNTHAGWTRCFNWDDKAQGEAGARTAEETESKAAERTWEKQ